MENVGKLGLRAGVMVISAFMFMGASPAYADKYYDSYTDGAHAYSYGTHKSAAIKDRKCDGHATYLDYERANGDNHRLFNEGGCGDTERSYSSSNKVIGVQACEDLPSLDDCGPWDVAGDGH